MSRCAYCGAELPELARFCHQCGKAVLFDAQGDPVPPPPGEQAIADAFFLMLEQKVVREQDANRVGDYFQRFHDSEFRRIFERRVRQLSEALLRVREQSEFPARDMEQLMGKNLDELSDTFLIQHAADLNAHALPKAILRYTEVDLSTVDRYQMVHDFLDFDTEPNLRVYTDFLRLDPKSLRRATEYFLKPERDERLFFLCDQSILGNFREGFGMTDKALYWKAHLEVPRSVRYTDVESVDVEKDWLLINGEFFNAGMLINVRLLKLLRKLAG
jgi:hypothetical protein